MEDRNQTGQQLPTIKKSYCPPELSLYGDVTQLTKGGGGGTTDGNMTMA